LLRLIAGGLLLFGMSLVGIAIKRVYKTRHEIFKGFKDFSVFLKNEIAFLKTPLENAVNAWCQGKKGHTAQILGKFLKDLKDDKVGEDYFSKIELTHLKQNDKRDIARFLYSLGKLPLAQQLNELDRHIAYFESSEKKSAEEEKRLGGMYFKLFVLLGIALMIIVA